MYFNSEHSFFFLARGGVVASFFWWGDDGDVFLFVFLKGFSCVFCWNATAQNDVQVYT